MISVDYSKCTGCGACIQSCPTKCIRWEERELGFKYPIIDETQCIECNRCSLSCPVDKIGMHDNNACYAGISLDSGVRMTSTSGGIFSALAFKILKEGGVVYGCTLSDQLKAQHIRVDEIANLNNVQGSKYIQSDTLDTFTITRKDLRAGRKVLYSGTPCQIAGLKTYLRREYSNLLTVDLVCHGVGSQAFFDHFLNTLSENGKMLKDVRFRDKSVSGWTCNGSLLYCRDQDDHEHVKPFYNHRHYYYYYYLNGDIYRESCYVCPYASMKRPGDITLGDFWGAETVDLKFDTEEGCSLVLTNTEKGDSFLTDLDGISLQKIDVDVARRKNVQLQKPARRSKERDRLISWYTSKTPNEIQRLFRSYNIKDYINGEIKCHIPYNLRLLMRRYIY